MSTKMSGGPIKAERIQSRVRAYRGWEYDAKANRIHRTYKFPSFPAAIRFVAFVAELAEAADHHPDIDVRYDKVRLALSTHSAGGVTDRDFALAAQIDQR
ncbi:MAG TPA: 4a-hydroxytetrahydrobiopterin dehydratase [Thermoanaerobaculia bacterium]|nr:4a-hydroxytetrahydrobiopterin dehydratase [Thermoanaerobaculia bacterium]